MILTVGPCLTAKTTGGRFLGFFLSFVCLGRREEEGEERRGRDVRFAGGSKRKEQ
jgi:hypothetical protein